MEVSVNISVRDLQNTDLPDIVAGLLASCCSSRGALSASRLPKAASMENPQRALQTLGRLRELGVRLSIDDFRNRLFVARLPARSSACTRSRSTAHSSPRWRTATDMVIVRSTIELAHNLGLNVVAEGIENKRSLARLRAMGCDEAQGFFISRPLPEDKLLEWLRTSPFGLANDEGASAARCA